MLMRLSVGLPGQHRKDKRTTKEVKAARSLGENSGNWVKELWPSEALAAIKTKVNEARDYHAKVTLPFGVKSDEDEAEGDKKTPMIAGIGILPGPLVSEYGDKMRQFKGEIDALVDQFLDNPKRYVLWAKQEQNGTFDPKNYPGCSVLASGEVVLDEQVFKAKMHKKFYFTTEPLPVPECAQFSETMLQLLGVDAESVDTRVRDASLEAQREVMRRLIEPVAAMAAKLAESPKDGKGDIIFRDTLVGNVAEIVALAPKLNLSGDPAIDQFVKEVEPLTRYTPDTLRSDKATRAEAAQKAADIAKKMAAYKL